MTESEMIMRCPDMIKVTPEIMMEIAKEKFDIEIDFNKDWRDNGFDDLDAVEMIMELEKRLNIVITDDVADAFISRKITIFRSYIRNEKLEQLGL
jgi:acyl carrier protein